MLSNYLRQCCLVIVPESVSPAAEFTEIHAVTAALDVAKVVVTTSLAAEEIWKKNDYSVTSTHTANTTELWETAFKEAFDQGFRKVILLFQTPKGLTQKQLEEAFLSLRILEVCMGPLKEGGLYLIGLNAYQPEILNSSNLDQPPSWKAFQKSVGAIKAAMYKLPLL